MFCDFPLENKTVSASSVPVYAFCEHEFASLRKTLNSEAQNWLEVQNFAGKKGGYCLIPNINGQLEKVLICLSDDQPSGHFDMGKLAQLLPAGSYHLATTLPHPETAALAFALGHYKFGQYKQASGQDERKATLTCPDGVSFQRVKTLYEGVCLARDLINIPANDLGPAELAQKAIELAEHHQANCNVIIGDDLLKDNFPMIFTVGAAATKERAPRLIDMTWGDLSHPKVTLVGKGVCFDTGGLDIKPSSAMLIMKKDMGGAANVLGLAHMIMALELPVRLRILIPAVENAISGSAFRPGDILQSRKGLSVEIGNTDAEGRLVLADALTLADDESPDLLVDMATLTGAARVALGPDLPALMTHDDAFAAELYEAGLACDDPVWRLPLWPRYDSFLNSSVADVNHISSGPYAGAVTAALFLNRFVEKAKTYAHLDMFAWTPSKRPARPEGGEAQTIRALLNLILKRYHI